MLNWSVAKKDCKNDAYAYCEYENIEKLFLLYHIVLLLQLSEPLLKFKFFTRLHKIEYANLI